MASPLDDFRQKLMNRGLISQPPSSGNTQQPAFNFFNAAQGLDPTPTGPANDQTRGNAKAQILGSLNSTVTGAGQIALGESAGSTLAKGTAATVGAPLMAGLAALDTGYRVMNTGVAGTVLAANDYAPWNIAARSLGGSDTLVNPLYRDGFQWDDVWGSYRVAWGDDTPVIGQNGQPQLNDDGTPVTEVDGITAGQALSAVFGRTALNVADAILPADIQANVNKMVEEDTVRAYEDPLNSRGLFSWMSGLHSEFTVTNKHERDSAFNQGLGRWISGTADAAVQWWLAPEVIGLKAAGLAGRSLLMKSLNEVGDIEKARESIRLHQLWIDGAEGGKKTDFGQLLSSFVPMSRTQVARHEIAKNSTDAALVARTFGDAKTFEEAADRFLALSGDLQAIDRLFAKDKVLGDALRKNYEDLADLRSQIDDLSILRDQDGTQFFNQFINRYQSQADRLSTVIDDAVKENKQLETALAGLNREAGLPDSVRFGEIRLSKLNFGPNSASRMSEKAIRAADRADGRHLWRVTEEKTGGKWGRTVRVFQSGYDYMKTQRIRGFARLTDANDMIAEVDASIQTLPMFRRLQKEFQGDAYLPGTDQLVSDFRKEINDRIVSARTPMERAVVLDDYEKRVFAALAAEYNVSTAVAGEILGKYQGLRQVVVEVARAKGLVIDSGEVNIIPEFQSLLAEGTPVMDFHFMEQVLRLERGTGIGSAKDYANLKGSRGLAAFDALWRPLVLMRLGYTARNVAEGGLRELAAFGSLGSMTDTGMGTRAVAGNVVARWAASTGRGVDRIGSLRYGRLKTARNNLRATQALAQEQRNALRETTARQDYVAGLLTKMVDAADTRARKQLLLEAKEELRTKVGVTWEQTTDLAYGEVDRMMREAQEIIVPVEYIRPLFGGAGRRANTVSGFDSVENAQIRVVNDTDQQLFNAPEDIINNNRLSPNDPASVLADGSATLESANVKRKLSAAEREQWDELEPVVLDGTADEWQVDLYGELQDRAAARAVRDSLRNGDTVVRTVDPSTGLYQVVHNPSDIMADDIADGVLGVLLKEDIGSVNYVRANVYGGAIDLRTSPVTDLANYRVNRDLRVELDEDEIAQFEGSLDDLQALHQQFFPGEEFLPGAPGTRRTRAVDVVRQIDMIAELAIKDPQVMEALALRRMAAQLPEPVREWMIDSGVLMSNKKLVQLAKRTKAGRKKAAVIAQEREELKDSIVERVTDNDYWYQTMDELGFDPTFHTGFSIKKGKLSVDPVNTTDNAENLLGIGFYQTRSGRASSGYFFSRVMDEKNADRVDDPIIYSIAMDEADELRYLDVDLEGNTFENEEFLKGIFDKMVNDALGRESTPADWEDVDDILFTEFVDGAFPISPGSIADDVAGSRVGDFMKAMQLRIQRELEETGVADADYASQMAWVRALRDEGYVGIRHQGGKNAPDYYDDEFYDHDVFVWYGTGKKKDTPKLVPVEDLTADMVHYRSLEADFQQAQKKAMDLQFKGDTLGKAAPYDPSSLDAAQMSAKMRAILAEYMRQNGVGRIMINDSYSPSGYQILTSPDMISVSTDQIDAVLPSGLIGKDFIDNALPQIEKDALVRNPRVLQPGNLTDGDLMNMFGSNRGVVNVLRGTSQGTPYEKAQLVRGLEVNGYTHTQIGASDSNTFTNASELVGNRATGAAYGAAIGDDVVAQRRNLILANDERFASLETEFGDLSRKIVGAEESFTATEATAKEAADRLTKRLGKRASGKPQKAMLGSGVERFDGRFDEFSVDGPFSAANQGSLNASLSSSGNTVMANLYGFTDYAQMALRRSMQQVDFTPGSNEYFQAMAEQLNRYWRNDLIGMAVIRGDADEDIMRELFNTKQGRAYIRDVEGYGSFKGFVDSSKLTEDARADLSQKIVDVRNAFDKLVPDENLKSHLASHEVTPDYLMSQLGWRTDLNAVSGAMMVDSGVGMWRNATGKIMHVLGTLPENAMVRHPFYRARWRDEMQRQADLYASQGVQNFSESQLNSMNQVAKKWALKQTNETLYTIQRLSTPAHMFKFVAPFFPAWASSMRFWLLRMPVQQPQNVARYAMAYNAPESAGWVYDENGDKVQGQSSAIGKIVDKAFGGIDGDIIIRTENETIRKLTAKVTGGLDTINLSKGGIDMMLQGETFWFPGLHIFLSVPATWLASQMPDVATAFETGDWKELPLIGDYIPEMVEEFAKESGLSNRAYRAAIPFGMVSKEKSILGIAAEQAMPALAKRFVTGFQGMSDAEFRNTANEIHRVNMTEWDLGGRQGKEPLFMEAAEQAQTHYMFRGLLNGTLPFSPRFQSRYQFYIDEARRIDRETKAAGKPWQDGNEEFIRLYGTAMYRYTQSLSSSTSGISATVGEMNEFNRDPKLMAQMASIGDDASFITMATRPFAEAMNEDGFDPAVYAWETDRMIEGTQNRYLRGGGGGESPEDRSQRELGWRAYDKAVESLKALAASRGTTLDNSEALQAVKKETVAKIGTKYKPWFEDYNERGGSRWIQSNTALQMMADSGYFEAHSDFPYAQSMEAFYEGRQGFVDELERRASIGGSANIDAKQNASLKQVYLDWVEKLSSHDTSGNFAGAWERFFQSDPLKRMPTLEGSND